MRFFWSVVEHEGPVKVSVEVSGEGSVEVSVEGGSKSAISIREKYM